MCLYIDTDADTYLCYMDNTIVFATLRSNLLCIWTDKAQQSFGRLTRLYSTLLDKDTYPHLDFPCILNTDALDVAVVLSRVNNVAEKPVLSFHMF